MAEMYLGAIAEKLHGNLGGSVILWTILLAMVPLVELKGAIPFAMSEKFWAESAMTAMQAFGYSFLGSTLVVPIIALVFKPLYDWLKTKKFFNKILGFFVGDIEKKSAKVNEDIERKSAKIDEDIKNESTKINEDIKNKSAKIDEDIKNESTKINEDIKNKSAKVNEDNKDAGKTKHLWVKIITVVLFVAFPVPLTGVWTGTCFAILLGLNFWQTCASVIFGNCICGLIVAFVCSVFPSATNILLYVFLGIVLVAFTTKLIMHFIKKRKNKTDGDGDNMSQEVDTISV